jgi:8-oxo-dGTP pyrophosphatase MutT (NUDIX family)
MARPEHVYPTGAPDSILPERTTLSAQVILLRSGKNGPEILLGHRVSGAFKNQWTSPGGKIDDDEHADDAAIRETEEETGVRLREEDLVFFRLVESRTKRKEYGVTCNYVIFIYVASGKDLKPYKASPKEFDKVEWISLKKALTMHEKAIKKAERRGIKCGPDGVPGALAPRTRDIIEELYSHPLANGKIPTEV